MVGAEVHESRIPPDVIDAVGVRPGHVGRGEIVGLHGAWLCRRPPLLARIREIPEQFLLLGVDRNDRRARRQPALHDRIDMAELVVAIRMLGAFFLLPVGLEAVVQRAQQLRHLRVAHWMPLACQRLRQHPCALASPPQRRFGIPA